MRIYQVNLDYNKPVNQTITVNQYDVFGIEVDIFNQPNEIQYQCLVTDINDDNAFFTQTFAYLPKKDTGYSYRYYGKKFDNVGQYQYKVKLIGLNTYVILTVIVEKNSIIHDNVVANSEILSSPLKGDVEITPQSGQFYYDNTNSACPAYKITGSRGDYMSLQNSYKQNVGGRLTTKNNPKLTIHCLTELPNEIIFNGKTFNKVVKITGEDENGNTVSMWTLGASAN